MRKLSVLVIVIMFLCTMVFSMAVAQPVTTPAKTITLKLSTFGPAVGDTEKILQQWADMVGQKSGGRVKIDCYYGGSLAKAADTRSAVEMGVVDIGFEPSTETPSLAPASLLLETPMMGFTGSRMATHVWGELLRTNPFIQKDFKSVNVLMAWMANGRFIHTTKKEIRVPKDMKGVRIVAWGTSANAVQLLGGVPVQQSPAELYASLDRGLAEGIVTAPFLVNLFKLDPVLHYHTYGVDLGYACLALLMNRRSWDSLPTDVQNLLEKELNPWAIEEMVKIDERSERDIQEAWRKKGYTITKISPEEIELWKQALQPLHEEVIKKYEAKGLPASEIFTLTKQMIKDYDKQKGGR